MTWRNCYSAEWRFSGFQCLSNGIAQQFLHGLFHGAGTKGFVDAAPEEKLERFFGNGEVETFLSQSSEFLGNGQSSNLPLNIRAQWFENDFFVKAPDQLGSKNAVEF